jgi:hypothetical protein
MVLKDMATEVTDVTDVSKVSSASIFKVHCATKHKIIILTFSTSRISDSVRYIVLTLVTIYIMPIYCLVKMCSLVDTKFRSYLLPPSSMSKSNMN